MRFKRSTCFLLFSAIWVYTTNRQLNINNASEKGDIDLLGDGRFNYPGYSAKYDKCTLLDRNYELILVFNVSHIRIAGNSAHMELDGFKQAFQLQVFLLTDISKSVVTSVRGQNKPSLWCLACGLEYQKRACKAVQTKALWGTEAMDKSHYQSFLEVLHNLQRVR